MKETISNKIGYIYKIELPNGKIYIGQTINIRNRKSKYRRGYFKNQKKLWLSCDKNEWDPTEYFSIIEECICGYDKSILNEREKYWIEFYNSYQTGLNCNKGGEGNMGISHTEETKQKIRSKVLGYRHTESAIEKIRKSSTGRKLSDEAKEKIRKSKKENPYKHSSESISKISNSLIGNKKRLGKKHTDETKDKISRSKSGKPSEHNSKKILCLNTGEIFNSQSEAAKKLNLNQSHISQVCLKNRKHTRGYIFIFLEETQTYTSIDNNS